MITTTMRTALALIGMAALAHPACDRAMTSPFDDGPATEAIPLVMTFASADVATACGEAAGIRVVISDGVDTTTCEAAWTAQAMVSAPYTAGGDAGLHYVADCFFLLPAGDYAVVSVEVIGDDLGALSCCSADYPDVVHVTAAMTTELGVEASCDLVGPGGLDIYGWLNRPPVLTDFTITPSKFGPACDPITLTAAAVDLEGDGIAWTWEVITAPDGVTDWQLDHDGPTAVFIGYYQGTYGLRVTVTDVPHGLSTSLDFPLHVTTTDLSCGPAIPGDCTYTQGYWRNHPAAWPVASLTLGAQTFDQAALLALFDQPPAGDATIILAHQLAAAKLNVALGAHLPAADALIADADALLTTHPVGSGPLVGSAHTSATILADALAAFNEGDADALVVCAPAG